MRNEKAAVQQKIANWQEESTKETAQLLSECTRSLGISVLSGQLMDFHGSGFRWLVDEPEFEDTELKNILKCFDSLEGEFNKFFSDLEDEVAIFIGHENPIKLLRNCSLMVSSFEKNGEHGILGILGPKRMNYQKNKFVLEETRKKIKSKR